MQEKRAAHIITQAARSRLARMTTDSFASPLMESRPLSSTPASQDADAVPDTDVMEQFALFFDLEMSCDEHEDLATALALSLMVDE